MMASIKKQASGKWRARYRDDVGKEHARHFERKVDGQQWLDEVTASIVTGNYVDPNAGSITFRQWFEQWSSVQVWALGTRETANMVAASVTFADVPMKKINALHIQAWLKSMTLPGPKRSNGLAASTRRTRYNYVRMAFLAAVKVRVIRDDPTADVTAPSLPKGESRMAIPTVEQLGDAIQVAPEGFRAYIAVCAFAGLRLGEASGLQFGDVNFLKRTLTVRRQVQGQTTDSVVVVSPKYGSGRTVYLPDDLVTMLSVHIERNELLGSEQWLFHWNGELLNRNSAGNQWRRIRARVGMEGFTIHSLRHFFASGLIHAGCDVVTVQRALGHSQSSITLNTYSHLWPNSDDRTRTAAAELMSLALADSVRTAVES